MEITDKKCTHQFSIEGDDFNGNGTIVDGHITQLAITINNKGVLQEIDLQTEETVKSIAKELNNVIEFLNSEKKLGHEQG